MRVVRTVCFGLLVSSALSAQTRLTLREAVTEALTLNPQLAAADGRIDQAAGQRVQAGLGPNPRLVLQTEDVRGWSAPFSYPTDTEEYAYVGQTFEVAGKRSKRVAVAAAELGSNKIQRDLVVRDVQAQVSNSYWAAEGAARVRDLLAEDMRTYEQDVTYSHNRVHEGVLPEADLTRIELERDRIRVQSTLAARQAEPAQISLARAIGRTDFSPVELTEHLDAIPPATIVPVADALRIRPEALLAQQSISRAEANIHLQHANARPDPEAFFGYKRNLGLNTLYAAVQVDLPLRNRNQGNIGIASGELRTAQANLASTQLNIKADFQSALRIYQDQRKLVDSLPATVDKAAEAERLARAAYREGGVDLIRYLDAERTHIEIEVQYAQALVLLRQSIINLRVASGQDLTGSSSP